MKNKELAEGRKRIFQCAECMSRIELAKNSEEKKIQLDNLAIVLITSDNTDYLRGYQKFFSEKIREVYAL
ncbi:Uncharacterised protein [uncultured archaeon]|nr:Uncharacterised protein [uncultured archaeon]